MGDICWGIEPEHSHTTSADGCKKQLGGSLLEEADRADVHDSGWASVTSATVFGHLMTAGQNSNFPAGNRRSASSAPMCFAHPTVRAGAKLPGQNTTLTASGSEQQLTVVLRGRSWSTVGGRGSGRVRCSGGGATPAAQRSARAPCATPTPEPLRATRCRPHCPSP